MFPPAQQLFKSFRDLPFEQLPENEDFRSHALQVTETISLAVSSLDDIEGLLLVLKDLGGAHSSYGLQDAHFDVSHFVSRWCVMHTYLQDQSASGRVCMIGSTNIATFFVLIDFASSCKVHLNSFTF